MNEAYRLQNERLKILTEFIQRPVCAYGGTEPDPDIISAYNLAVETTLQAIRCLAKRTMDTTDGAYTLKT